MSVRATWTDLLGQAEQVVSSATEPVAAPANMPTLSGIVYHWKSHALLADTTVTTVSNISSASSSDALQLRDVVYDLNTGALTAQVWVSPAANSLSVDFTALNTQALSASFTSMLSDQWSVITNAENPQSLGFAAVLLTGSSGLVSPTQVGTLSWTMQAGTQTATIEIADIEIGTTKISLIEHTLKSATTGSAGAFSFDRMPVDGYSISAERPTTDSKNAITAADALAALRIAVGLNPNPDPDGAGSLQAPKLSPYQIMAADVTPMRWPSCAWRSNCPLPWRRSGCLSKRAASSGTKPPTASP